MRVTWFGEDVVPGQRVGKEKLAERFIIGYIVSPKQLCIISLADGLCVQRDADPHVLAHFLTENHYLPEEVLDRKRKPQT